MTETITTNENNKHMLTAQECDKISQEPEMKYIFDWIERAARAGEKSTNLCIPVSEIQALKLKELGFIVTWHSHQEYSGGYKVYWGGTDMVKPKTFFERLHYKITEQVEYHI